MLLKPFSFYLPKSLNEASQLYASLPETRIIAGGTFLLNSLKALKRRELKTPQNVISLNKIGELKGIFLEGDVLIIKAMTSINELFDSPLLKDNFKVLRTVCRNISTNPIRNMATVGGNLTCRYTWTEMGAVMIALDATLHFRKPDGEEEIISAEDFFKSGAKTNKIFTHVTIKRDPTATIAYHRVRKTMHVDVPLLAVCVKTNFKAERFTHTRVTVNNGVAFAQRDRILEDFLNQSFCYPEIAKEALDHLDLNIYDKRSDDYKKHMFRVSFKNAIQELIKNQPKPIR